MKADIYARMHRRSPNMCHASNPTLQRHPTGFQILMDKERNENPRSVMDLKF